jgi:hypothetical protein
MVKNLPLLRANAIYSIISNGYRILPMVKNLPLRFGLTAE